MPRKKKAAKQAVVPKHAERKHNRFSPSGSHRWLKCPYSIEGEPIPSPMSEPAAFGTAEHELCDMVLTSHIQSDNAKSAFDYIGEVIVVTCDDTGKTFQYEVTEEMAKHANYYVQTILGRRRWDEDAVILCERKVSAGYVYTNEDGEELAGTVDAGVILPNLGEIQAIDLKYGAGVVVEAQDNTQALIYLAGLVAVAREMFPKVKWKLFSTQIYQPRAHHPDGSWRIADYTPEQFKKWLQDIRKGAARCDEPNPEAIAGDHCNWCPKAHFCQANSDHALSVAQADFSEAFEPIAPDQLTPEQIEYVLTHGKALRNWLTAVESHAYGQMSNGNLQLDGYKIVAGRGSQQWKKEHAALKVIEKKFGKEATQNSKNISPAQALQLLKDEGVEKEKIEGFKKKFINKIDGSPTIAPRDDNRIEIESSASTDFTPVAKKTKTKKPKKSTSNEWDFLD